MTHFCFVRISMSDANLPDCSSAAICRTEPKLTNYGQEGSTSNVITRVTIRNAVGQHNEIGDITVGVR
jgi:hypothetical protein